MKNTIFIAFLGLFLFSINHLSAQDISVNFPDNNFRQAVWEWLGNSGEALAFTAADIQSRLSGDDDQLNVAERNIADLSGLEYFQGLESLDCSNNEIAELPALPDSLVRIDCFFNQLKQLPELPESLSILYCYKNQLTSLPELPSGLTELYCAMNELMVLPELPQNLEMLRCYVNKITTLPTLPDTLWELRCFQNPLEELPELPENLEVLMCFESGLTRLPELPSKLELLYCEKNQLTQLPDLPSGLKRLYCNENLLSRLPELPKLPGKLVQLKCDSNELLQLPEFPESLVELTCSNNWLTQLPVLPQTLKTLICDTNYINLFEGSIAENIDALDLDLLSIDSQYRFSSQAFLTLEPGSIIDLPFNDTMVSQRTADGKNWTTASSSAKWSDFELSTTNSSVATVSPEGILKTLSVGKCVIEARYKGIDSEYTTVRIPLSVGNFEKGDVNHDLVVNIVDALLIAQYYVGIDVTVFFHEQADYNADGLISIVDTLLIAQAYVGYEDK